MNKLYIRADKRTNEAALFGADGDIIEPAMFHTFVCPYFVLDERLKYGLSTCPKWEPWSQFGIYVGYSPAHAGTVALVLNPRIGHVSPQFNIFFDDLFTTVSFMNKIQLPPNWAEIVKNSLEIVTEERFNLVNTWLFPEAYSGNNASIPQPSQILQQAGNFGTSAKPNTAPTASPTSNILASSQTRLSVCEGDNELSSNNGIESPKMINLATSGLRQPKQIKNMMNPKNPNNDGPAIMAYTPSVKNESPFNRPNRKKPILEFFSIFCAVGALSTISTSLSLYFHNKACH